MISQIDKYVQKQELLVKLYDELISKVPTSKKELDVLQIRCRVAKEEIVKVNRHINGLLEKLRNV